MIQEIIVLGKGGTVFVTRHQEKKWSKLVFTQNLDIPVIKPAGHKEVSWPAGLSTVSQK